MKIFVTADQHFGHANIIKHCSRPFKTAADMDAVLKEAWNSTVSKGDVVYHLGDFAWHRSAIHTQLLNELNGTKHLIRGNHDPRVPVKGWMTVKDYAEVPLGDGKFAILSHYRMMDWHGQNRGNVMFHGHSHGKLSPTRGCLDVGVDSVGWKPLELSEAVDLAHGRGL